MKTLSVSVSPLPCFLSILLFISCDSSRTTSDTADTLGQSTPQRGTGMSSGITTLYLDTLSTDASVFTANRNKNFVFVHYLSDTSATLHGWVMKNMNPNQPQFDTIPDIKFVTEGKTNVSIGSEAYVGNQVLLRSTVIKIIREINGRKTTLLFVPKKDTSGKLYYQILIKLQNKKMLIPKLEDLRTNPSPPHQGFD